MRKYEFTGETKILFWGNVVKRIRRLSDGLVGGWIEKEENLSHEGDCFVYDNAIVSENARVFGNAKISENAQLYGKAKVYGNAGVSEYATIQMSTCVYGTARISGKANVYGNARVSGCASVSGNAEICGNARVFGNVLVSGCAYIYQDAKVTKCLYLQQPRNSITVTDDYIFIGCKGHSYTYWSRHIEKIGKDNGYSSKEIRNTKELLSILKKQIKELN